MKVKTTLIAVLFIFTVKYSYGQNVHLYGMLPSIGYQKKLNNYLSLNLNTNSQTYVIERNYDGETYPAMVKNINFATGINYQYSPHLQLAASFLFRMREPMAEGPMRYQLRPWQQFTLIHRLDKYRFRNRFRIEQRIFTGQKDNFDIRLRYRLSTDFPLSGKEIDVGEAYINLNYEIVSVPTMERFLYFRSQRPYAGIGFQLDNYNRLEIGPQFRVEKMENGFRENVIFLVLSWSHSK